MKFPHKTPPDINFDVLRLESENHVWEIGVRRVLYGYRVCMNRIDADCYLIDYCCGSDSALLLQTLAMVAKILEDIPEDATDKYISSISPYNQVKPVNKDSVWSYLQERSGICLTESPESPESIE